MREETSSELVFGVVGHIGSGASEVGEQLNKVLFAAGFTVHTLKARDAIVNWAERAMKKFPARGEKDTFASVSRLQDLGDEMRRTTEDHAAVARALVHRIRAARAKDMAVELKPGEAVHPDNSPRAFILDSIRHPAEVELLRHVYRSAFVLLGVVCEEDERQQRIMGKLADAGKDFAQKLMVRDAKAAEKWGQRVSDAFYLAHAFLDNTAPRFNESKTANRDWDIPDQLTRLVRSLTRSHVVRPTPHETAMFVAQGARLRSACLSRQVGAALLDRTGNLIATGTNEAPRAGGGVYGSSLDGASGDGTSDHRCAFTSLNEEKYCSNTREQSSIVSELLASLKPFVNDEIDGVDEKVSKVLKDSRIGSLLEFSRAVHAEMDAILSALRTGATTLGARLYVTTFPCHYCARHLVAAGLDEIQYIEPYPKSRALKLHSDAITTSACDWRPPSQGGEKVLVRPFTGIAPYLYERVFTKDVELKNDDGGMEIGSFPWGDAGKVHRISYAELEAKLARDLEVS